MKNSLLVAAGLLVGATNVAHAFSGEDPVFGHPYHHEAITRNAAKAAGFSFNAQKDAPDPPLGSIPAEIAHMAKPDPRRPQDGAAESLAWHADYLDSYLYSPIWWANGKDDNGQKGPAGILKRYKASRAVETELKNVHFDDLFSTNQVNAMWRRYASGTFAGLMWASEQNGGQGDVFAAHNILGASLHAMEDFYSHSSWVDKPERRTKTFFEYPRAQRLSDNFFTGAYEHDHQLGVKSHGKWVFQDTLWGQPGVKEAMEAGCDPLSPFSNSDACQAWKAVKAGTPMQPTVGGLKLPPSVMVYTPAGIALDNSWVADEAVKQRGLDIKGSEAFTFAHDLAVRHATQWLQTLEKAMTTAGKKAFWDKVKTTASSDAERESQFENYGRFPFMFMAVGPYPPANPTTADEWYLRIKLHTAQGRTAGTNSDIAARTGGKKFPLDYLKDANPALAYNDFEAGDNDAYVVGPFDKCPEDLDLINDAANGKELLGAIGRDFKNSVEQTAETIGDVLMDVVGAHADKVAVNKQLWMPEDLAAMPVGGAGQGFNIDLNGGKEGNYRANGRIVKVGEDEANYEFEVHIDTLSCIAESKWDRASDSDEPFLLTALNPLPGEQQAWRSPVYKDVDKGETPNVGHGFTRVSIPKSSGMLNLAVSLMESDDESSQSRQELLEKFAGTWVDKTKDQQRSFVAALGTTVAAKWKLADIEVVAWSRNGRVRQGVVLKEAANRWIEPGTFANFKLNPAGARDTGVSTDDLLPQLGAGQQPTTPGTPTTPENPTTPETPTVPAPSFDLATWVDEWDTTYGRVKLELTDGVLRGRLYIASEFGGRERESDRLELRADNAVGALVGTANYTGVATPVTLLLSADGNSFTGTSGRPGMINRWTGKRRRTSPTTPTTPVVTPPTVPTTPTTPVVTPPTVPTTPTVPVVTPPTVPTTPTVPIVTPPTAPTTPTTPAPGTGGGTGNLGGFRPLGDWSVQIESARVARDNQIEVVALFKNVTRVRQAFSALSVNMVITDADGVGVRNIGNLYRAGGEPDMQPELFPGGAVESGSPLRVLYLFDIPAGTTPLKTLTVYGQGARVKPLTFNLAGLAVPEPLPAVSFPIPGTVGGQSEFADFNQYGIRFDGVRKGKNGALQVFLTVQNRNPVGFQPHPSFSLDVAVIDQDGITHGDEGNMYRASGGALDLVQTNHNIVMISGSEATICYPVPLAKGTVAKQLLLQFDNKKHSITLPPVP